MTGPAFVADRQEPAQPSLFDFVIFGAFAPGIWPVRPHLRPEPWLGTARGALLLEPRGTRRARRVDLEIAHAVAWEGEG
jgi:hypothetical protein